MFFEDRKMSLSCMTNGPKQRPYNGHYGSIAIGTSTPFPKDALLKWLHFYSVCYSSQWNTVVTTTRRHALYHILGKNSHIGIAPMDFSPTESLALFVCFIIHCRGCATSPFYLTFGYISPCLGTSCILWLFWGEVYKYWFISDRTLMTNQRKSSTHLAG